MKIKGLIDEDFVNYKKASMFIIFPYCTFKCEKDCGIQCCQNSKLALDPILDINIEYIVKRYIDNLITKAIVFGGLEPFDSWNEIYELISALRQKTSDDIVIYTGYKENEIQKQLDSLKRFKNIIIKFGRFIPNDQPKYDEILGVTLASKNQYAKQIS